MHATFCYGFRVRQHVSCKRRVTVWRVLCDRITCRSRQLLGVNNAFSYMGCVLWTVFRGMDYLPKTNAGGGVCCHHSKLISYPHVFFPPKFSYFLYQFFYFFYLTFLCCDDIEYILDTNCVLHTKLYAINVISTFFTKKKKKLNKFFFLVDINDKLCTIKVAILCYVHSYLLSQLIIIIYKHNIDNTELLLLMVLRIVIEAADYTMCEYISSQYQTICNIVFRR